MDRHPLLEETLADTCTRCHTPMANETARKDGTTLAMFDGGFLDARNPLFDHAMEGVSCTLCHQVEDDGLLGSVEGVSGNFSIREYQNASDRPAYGPYSDPSVVYMRMQTQFNPIFGPHPETSESCAACHDLRTPTAHSSTGDSAGAEVNLFPEQMVFAEWRNSAFGTNGSSPPTCQSCHMPEVPGSVILASDGDGVLRDDFSRLTFVGANTVMQNMLMTFEWSGWLKWKLFLTQEAVKSTTGSRFPVVIHTGYTPSWCINRRRSAWPILAPLRPDGRPSM